MTSDAATELLIRSVLLGIGATALMDLWAVLLKQMFGLPASNWRMVGRWVGHFPRGQFVHQSIGSAAPIHGELAIGWTTHYVVGVLYALLLLLVCGLEWAREPTLLPALITGLAMLVAPFFMMQPGMGAGIASSKMPNPNAVRLRSVSNHAVFGLGLYLSALLVTVMM